ncbi:MAG: AAA family ATPase [Candidatus Hodarchaeota archaeon]
MEGYSISDLSAENQIEYIQQKDEFDYLRCLINSIDRGKCVGILLHGPPGTGKTLLAISLAKSYHASYYIIDGSPDLDRRDIEGNWELLKGDTKFNYGPLTLAINDANESGISFIIINEINAIRENEQISLNSLLSENHINLISKGFEKHQLNSESKLIIIGTMNKGVAGINKLQEAFEDRFIICPEINYPLKNKEIEIVAKISGCKEKIAEIVVDTARQIRKQAIQDFSITKIFSTRLVVNFCMLISKMPSVFLKNNIENVIINKLGITPEEKKSIAMIIDGKMLETKIREELEEKKPVELIKESIFEIKDESVNKIISITKVCFEDYIDKYGMRNAFRYNGHVMWKVIHWMWMHNRKSFQQYIQLTEVLNLPYQYKEETGKTHLYNGAITLSYIRWIYQTNLEILTKIIREIFPVV